MQHGYKVSLLEKSFMVIKKETNLTSSSLIITHTHSLTHKRKNRFRLWLNMNVCTDESIGYFPSLNTLAV